jgi:hypothetical protein
VRAVSLSNDRVISLLNQYFVPVYLSNEDFRDSGAAPPAEKAELHRIHGEGYAAKLSVGTVHAYVLAPDGHLVDSMHTVEVAKPDKLTAMLERAVQKFALQPGTPVVKPCPPAPPSAGRDQLRLHVTARYLERHGDDYTLVRNAGGNWSALPGEDWLLLDRSQWSKLLPPSGAKPGDAWTIDGSLAETILTRFYPPTENNDLATNRFESVALKATLVSVTSVIARARLEGRFRLKHPFYHKEDGNHAEAGVVGFLEYEPVGGRIRSLRLVTDQASYGEAGRTQPYGVALRTVP